MTTNTKEPLRSEIKSIIDRSVSVKSAIFHNFPGGDEEMKSLQVLIYEMVMPTVEQALLSRDREILEALEQEIGKYSFSEEGHTALCKFGERMKWGDLSARITNK